MGFEYGDRFARQAAADVTGIVDYLQEIWQTRRQRLPLKRA